MFAGREIPAIGISIGLERILEVSEEFGLVHVPGSVCDAIVVFRDDVFADAAALASELRAAGLRIDLSLLSNRSYGDQLKYADRRQIPVAVIVGADELASGSATIKNLRSGEQSSVARSDLVAAIRASA